MMDGLEAAEINLSAVVAGARGRMDAEYFARPFVANAAVLSGFPSIGDFARPSRRVEVRRLRLNREFNYLEISGVELDGMGCVAASVPPDEAPHRAAYVLRDGDVVVSTVRPNRNAAALIRGARRLAATSGFAVLRAKEVAPEFLFAWCKTRPFVVSLVRETTATMYPAVSVDDILRARIFRPGENFERRIQSVVRQSARTLDDANALYQQAESRLLKEIGMDDWRPDDRGWTVKNFSETLKAHDRLDAEYYHPMHDGLFAVLRRVGCAPLGSLADIRKSIEPGSAAYRGAGIPFLRVADFSKFGFSAPSKFLDADEYGGLSSSLGPRADSVLLTKDGTPGVAYRAEENMAAITSSAILHLTARCGSEVSADYLALALNSLPLRMQAARDMGGTVIRHWRPDQIRAALIPLPPEKVRRELSGLARESFRLRRESRRLLDAAVRAVECAAEKGEQAGADILEKTDG